MKNPPIKRIIKIESVMKNRITILALMIISFTGFTGCMGVSHLVHSSNNNNGVMATNENIQSNQMDQNTFIANQVLYTCPMHPEIHSENPGNCPKCGMELVVQNSVSNSNDHANMNCMGMMQPNNKKSHIGMYLGGGVMMVGMMTLMVLRFL